MSLSQTEFESLLRRIREQQTESSIVECKVDLPLNTEGDRAFFIRHIAALSNNVEPSYLVIGIENRTWNAVGLPGDSSLRQPDQTQQRMNQVLSGRLDPNVSARYRTYEVEGAAYGLVEIEGTRAPYVIAIRDRQYGGNRTRGEPSYIYRGAIYIRHGANSIVANRQSELLDIIHKVQQAFNAVDQVDEFLTAGNYLNVESTDFGHHALSKHLVEAHMMTKSGGLWDKEFVPANSWVSFTFCPADRGCEIDTVGLKSKLRPDQRIGREGKWYHGISRPVWDMLSDARSTPKEFSGQQSLPIHDNGDITHFIRIQPSGYIEIGCSYPLFWQRDDVRCFGFVGIVGYLWQMLYLARAIYRDAGYHGYVTILLNLAGTAGTRLADFAKSKRGGWASPFGFEYGIPREQETYRDLNI